MPLQQTTGNVTTDAYGGGVAAVPNYIEDVFSTYLYTGTGASRSIVNGIDLSTKGGLVWSKVRNIADTHVLEDTVRGAGKMLFSNDTSAQITDSTTITSFNTTGYTIGTDANQLVNASGNTYASWTFRKQPKFFDVVTYTGDGTNSNRRISHNLGSAPACIIVKRTDSTSDWVVYHRSLPATTTNRFLMLNSTAAYDTSAGIWGTADPTSTDFGVGNSSAKQNMSGATYVAYLFAHNAGGFGLAGTDNVISCGSYSGTGALNTITLGYEPQWIMVKNASAAGDNWVIIDNMRGFPAYSTIGGATLFPNLSDSENSGGSERFGPTATGFQVWSNATLNNASGNTYIYIAIRRGPMKVPTSGTSVFDPQTYTGNDAQPRTISTGFPVDAVFTSSRQSNNGFITGNRLFGKYQYLETAYTTAVTSNNSSYLGYDSNTSLYIGASGLTNNSAFTYIQYGMKRAPSFFDEICWTGTSSNGGATATFNHNLGVVPEMIIVKLRAVNGASGYTPDWFVYTTALNSQYGYPYNGIYLNSSAAFTGIGMISSAPTTTTFTLEGQANVSPATYVAYLFATCAGVSKVGSYTGNGSTQTINCGFTGGARFVLIKRTDSTGGWYVYDTARGMTTLTDPYLLMNSTAAESATLGSVTTVSTGFAVNASILAAINTNAASYIFLAIA